MQNALFLQPCTVSTKSSTLWFSLDAAADRFADFWPDSIASSPIEAANDITSGLLLGAISDFVATISPSDDFSDPESDFDEADDLTKFQMMLQT